MLSEKSTKPDKRQENGTPRAFFRDPDSARKFRPAELAVPAAGAFGGTLSAHAAPVPAEHEVQQPAEGSPFSLLAGEQGLSSLRISLRRLGAKRFGGCGCQ